MQGSTDGLVSGYQITSVTATGALAIEETGGLLLVGVTMAPSYRRLFHAKATELPLDEQMQQASFFGRLAQRGLADLQEGRYKSVEDLKRRLGDI